MAVAEFYCVGDIFQMFLGDQFHDFLGERSVKQEKTKEGKQSKITELRDKILKNWKKYVPKDFRGGKGSFQTQAEMIIEDAVSQPFKSQGFGGLNSYVPTTYKGDYRIADYQQDLGVDVRMYIQQLIKQLLGEDIITTNAMANIHIDAVSSNKNLISAMKTTQDSRTALEYIRVRPDLIENYMKRIKATPVLGNLYDQAILDGMYRESMIQYEDIIEYRNQENYKIRDYIGNSIEWTLAKIPEFYNIAKWFLEQPKIPNPSNFFDNKDLAKSNIKINTSLFNPHNPYYDTSKVNQFLDLLPQNFQLEAKDLLYFFMINGIDHFLSSSIDVDNKKVTMSDLCLNTDIQKSIKQVFKGFSGRQTLKGFVTKPRSENIRDQIKIICYIYDIYIIKNDKIIAQNFRRKPKEYMSSIVKYTMVTYLKLNGEDYTENIIDQQIKLKLQPSVANITNLITKTPEPDDIFVLFMCKTLGDLSVICSSFYEGIRYINKYGTPIVNFFASFDITAIQIASTLSINNTPIAPYVLKNSSLYTKNISVFKDFAQIENFEPGFVEYQTAYILESMEEQDKLNNALENCELFRQKLIEDNYPLDVKDITCSTYNKEVNWDELSGAKTLIDLKERPIARAKRRMPQITKDDNSRLNTQQIILEDTDMDTS